MMCNNLSVIYYTEGSKRAWAVLGFPVIFQINYTRFYDSAKMINLEIPKNREEMANLVCETIKRTGLKDAYVRLVVSRGPGDLGMDPRKCPRRGMVIIVQQADPMYGDLYDKGIRGDDLEFHTAVREWETIIRNGDTVGYQNQFIDTKEFFKDRLIEGRKKSVELINRLSKH